MTNEEKDRLHKAADEYAKRFSPWLYSCIMEAFVDGAEWQKKQTIDKAIEHIKNHWNEILVYDCNQFGGYIFNMKKTLDNFKKAME